jgi:hypothetical protein
MHTVRAGMSLEQMLEELNESDVVCDVRDLYNSIGCLESVENVQDFRCNVTNAIDEAETLLRDLKALQAAVSG